jgi:serine phosphatase RsbU (regulator of sigma subunit)
MLKLAIPESDIKYRLLLDISQQISRTIDLQDVVAGLLGSVRSVVEYDAAGIFVLHRNVPFSPAAGTNMIAAMATVGFEHIADGRDPMLRSGKGIVGHVIRTGDTVVAPDVSRDPRYIEGRVETRSEIAVPIVSNGEVIGALNLESDQVEAFSAADAELLEALAVAAAICIEKAVLHQQVVEKRLMEQQLKIAREVQGSLLPAGAPVVAGHDIAGRNLPAWDIGGDYFDYFPLEHGRLGLVIADVSGKGVPAALLMATFRAALRSEVRRNQPIPAAIEEVHRTLVESMDTSRFVTAVYGILDPRLATFTYTNCGHNPPLLLRAGGEQEFLRTGRRAVGMLGSQPTPACVVTLNPGDTLVLYTDGVVEVTDANQAEFGTAGLARVISDSAAQPADGIITALVDATRAHAGRDRYDDDFTIVVVKRM